MLETCTFTRNLGRQRGVVDDRDVGGFERCPGERWPGDLNDSAGAGSANAPACARIGRSPFWLRRQAVAPQPDIRESSSNIYGCLVSSFGNVAIVKGLESVGRSDSGIDIGSIGRC